MPKKAMLPLLGLSLVLWGVPSAQGQQTTSTTTVEATTVQKPAVKKGKRTVAPAEETTTTSTTTTTTTPPPPKEVVHKVYDEEMLKKMKDNLCTDGFKAYVGSDKKNVCRAKAAAPDFAYSCVWDKKGPAAFAPTEKGPCNLDYTEHRGSVKIQKENYPSSPPLSYGMEAQCCYRPAKGLEPVSSQ
ncbi:MAG: hypothetical protein U1F57_07305 [bacterium]